MPNPLRRNLGRLLRATGLYPYGVALRKAQIEWCAEARQRLYYPVRAWKLRRGDRHKIPRAPGEIRMFLVVRNEAARLPFLFSFYAAQGVERFFVVDNASTDHTLDFLMAQPRTHVWVTRESYRHSLCGQRWMNILLRHWGRGHWCLVGDADELFVYPHAEDLPLKGLARYLDSCGAEIVNSLVVDLYARQPLSQSVVRPGEDPRGVLRYFDTLQMERSTQPLEAYGGMRLCMGGTRKRCLGVNACLNKVPFLKYRRGMVIKESLHWVGNARPADIEGATLHFKFTADFLRSAFEEAQRREHWQEAVEYRRYAQELKKSPDLSFSCADSVALEGSASLLDAGLMSTSPRFEQFCAQEAAAGKKKP